MEYGDNQNSITLEMKKVGRICGDFFVPSYQRGYRWGKNEVRRLLGDVYQNGPKNYCLQPVVVSKNGDKYDLIDGQQRLTTIYLIYKYINEKNSFYPAPAFTLSYGTRNETEEFLKNIEPSRQEENIDFWFISNAYKTIAEWFAENGPTTLSDIYGFFDKYVHIIWYEVTGNTDQSDAERKETAISLFTRLNIGKIPLTSAELVKAMFLSRSDDNLVVKTDRDMEKIRRKREEQQKQQDEIAMEWDNIERELRDKSFWYFLTNANHKLYPTRLDLLLDLIAEKGPSEREKYYTFFKFDEKRRIIKEDAGADGTRKAVKTLWEEIQQAFLYLRDWHEDHELYHKIGYLIASESESLQDIYNWYRTEKKEDFKAHLDNCIKKSIHFETRGVLVHYADLNYESNSDKLKKLLLLFNVESMRQLGKSTEWFPFAKLKNNEDDKQVVWSLEHIHAQHSENMRTQEVWKEWLRLHIPSVKAVSPESTELITQMEQASSGDTTLYGKDFEKLRHQVEALFHFDGDMHTIGNLALLTLESNAALNNSTFDVKRTAVIAQMKEGAYIPFCTRMVFLKCYTATQDNQMHFWGAADRQGYIKEINRVLKNYLSEPITGGDATSAGATTTSGGIGNE